MYKALSPIETLPVEILTAICGFLPTPVSAAATSRAFADACDLAWEAAYAAGEAAFVPTIAEMIIIHRPCGFLSSVDEEAAHHLNKLPHYVRLGVWLRWHVAHTSDPDWLELYLVVAMWNKGSYEWNRRGSSERARWLESATRRTGRTGGDKTVEHAQLISMSAYRQLAAASRAQLGPLERAAYERVAERLFDLYFDSSAYMKSRAAGVLPLIRFLSSDALTRVLIYWPLSPTSNKDFISAGFRELTSRLELIPDKYVVPLWIKCGLDGETPVSSMFDVRAKMLVGVFQEELDNIGKGLIGQLFAYIRGTQQARPNQRVNIDFCTNKWPKYSPGVRWLLPMHSLIKKAGWGRQAFDLDTRRKLRDLYKPILALILCIVMCIEASQMLLAAGSGPRAPFVVEYNHLEKKVFTYHGPHTAIYSVARIYMYDASPRFVD